MRWKTFYENTQLGELDLKRLLSQKSRNAIVRSILSRDEASYRQQIEQDVPLTSGVLQKHLERLKAAHILAVMPDPRYGNRLLYYIDPDGPDSLQDVLRELFPEEMAIER